MLEATDTNGYIVYQETYERASDHVDLLASLCHRLAKANHWWDKERNVPEMLCLIHSEISEAMEGHRKGYMDEHLPEFPSIAVELADALIRIFDLAGGLNLPLGQAFAEKLCYNQIREDHKIETRRRPGGKEY